METTTISGHTVLERMQQRHIRLGDLARECEMYPTHVGQILAGRLRFGPQREARLARGIVKLGLDVDAPPPPPQPSESVVIRIRQT